MSRPAKAAFTAAQTEALAGLLAESRRDQVTRAEHEELAAMVRELLARLPPAPQAEVTPEVIAIIAAAVTAYLGKPVRVRGARLVSAAPANRPSPWQQQGRVSIQASHDLGARRSG